MRRKSRIRVALLALGLAWTSSTLAAGNDRDANTDSDSSTTWRQVQRDPRLDNNSSGYGADMPNHSAHIIPNQMAPPPALPRMDHLPPDISSKITEFLDAPADLHAFGRASRTYRQMTHSRLAQLQREHVGRPRHPDSPKRSWYGQAMTLLRRYERGMMDPTRDLPAQECRAVIDYWQDKWASEDRQVASQPSLVQFRFVLEEGVRTGELRAVDRWRLMLKARDVRWPTAQRAALDVAERLAIGDGQESPSNDDDSMRKQFAAVWQEWKRAVLTPGYFDGSANVKRRRMVEQQLRDLAHINQPSSSAPRHSLLCAVLNAHPGDHQPIWSLLDMLAAAGADMGVACTLPNVEFHNLHTNAVLFTWATELHSRGMSMEHRDDTGATMLNSAAYAYPRDPQLVEFLLGRGADANIHGGDSGRTPAMDAFMTLQQAKTQLAAEQHEWEASVQQGIVPGNNPHGDGNGPGNVHMDVDDDNHDDDDDDVDDEGVQDEDGVHYENDEAFEIAILREDVEDSRSILQLLIAASDVNLPNCYGQTIVHATALVGDSARDMERLILHGADLDMRDQHRGRTPLDLAILGHEFGAQVPQTLSVLWEAGARPSGMYLDRAAAIAAARDYEEFVNV